MLEKAELTLIIMLSKTKKVITTHLIVLCSVASRKLFYSIAWRVGTLSLQFVPPAEGGGMEIIMTQLNVTKDNKIQEYIKEKENPYCFFSESTKVTISFIKNGRTLEEQLLKCIVANRTI